MAKQAESWLPIKHCHQTLMGFLGGPNKSNKTSIFDPLRGWLGFADLQSKRRHIHNGVLPSQGLETKETIVPRSFQGALTLSAKTIGKKITLPDSESQYIA